MKVVAFNGSPRADGNTYLALKMIASELESAGIDVEIIHVGNQAIAGCTACNGCARNRDGKCVLPDDGVNEWIEKMKESDGILLGSPVYYGSVTSTMRCFLDRAFYTAGNSGGLFRHKVAAPIVAVRRVGGLPALDQLTHYITSCEMLMPSGNSWPVIYGLKPGEAERDDEGVQAMEQLGKNMVWLMKLVENGKGVVPEPAAQRKKYTNLIR